MAFGLRSKVHRRIKPKAKWMRQITESRNYSKAPAWSAKVDAAGEAHPPEDSWQPTRPLTGPPTVKWPEDLDILW